MELRKPALLNRFDKIDPRYFQILALTTLASIQITQSDFSSPLLAFPVIIVAIVVAHYLSELWVFRNLKSPLSCDYRSVVISALSIFLLLRASEMWIYLLAACICVLGKVVFRTSRGHVFNPANLAIVVCLLILPQYVWVSPGQWGNSAWLAGLLVCLAALVLSGARQLDMAVLFFISFGGLVLGRSLWLGDPLEIPLHGLQNGALLIFTFFMITDPKTTPVKFSEKALFAFAVAAISVGMIFIFQIREALFYALILVCAGYGIAQSLIMKRGYNSHEKSFA